MTVFPILGWIGTLLYLLNHVYIASVRDWKPQIYYAGNMSAAIFLVISSFVVQSWQAVVINLFWAIISLVILFHSKLKFSIISNRLFYLSLVAIWVCILIKLAWVRQFDFALLGWSSTLAFSGSYLLFCTEKIPQRYYFLFNAYAAAALMPQLWLDHHWPALTLEIAWAIISVMGAVRRFWTLRLID